MPEYIRDFVETKDILLTAHGFCKFLGIQSLAEAIQNAINSGAQVNPEYIVNVDAGKRTTLNENA